VSALDGACAAALASFDSHSALVAADAVDEATGLRLFEMERPPRASRDVEVNVNVVQLKNKFTCPVCLSILRQTTTVMACLHRFCGNCIKAWLGAGCVC